jgi:hypothetical protein
MKRLLAMSTILLASVFTLPDNPHSYAAAAKCVGANPCRACKTCEYCKHCNAGGGHCGVCKKRRPE